MVERPSLVRVLLFSLFLLCPRLFAQTVPPQFSYDTVISGLTQAVSIAFAGPDRMYIAEKQGTIRVAIRYPGGWKLLPRPFLELPDTNAALDRGLLALAVHPDFPRQPFVYAYYTFDPPGLPPFAAPNGSRVARLIRVEADAAEDYSVARPDSRVVLLGKNSTLANAGDVRTPDSRTFFACQGDPAAPIISDCIPADSDNHAGADLKFGPDGSLYLSLGDATPPNGNWRSIRAQDLDSVCGKILRIDPLSGLAYPDNPFFNGDPSSNRSKVISYGLRNPFRFSIEPLSQELYIGDVGWDTWEELNIGRGRNFGWPCYEGGGGTSLPLRPYANIPACQALYQRGDATPPAYSYPHNGAGASIVAGTFYQGSSYPAAYHGAYFIYDFNLTWIKTLSFAQQKLEATDFAQNLGGNNDYSNGIVQIVSGPESDLYTVNLATIRQLRYLPGNLPPKALASSDKNSGLLPLPVQFSAAESSDPEGHPLSFAWDFGDGQSSELRDPLHVYTAAGIYTVTLSVRDSAGVTAGAQLTIFAGNSAPTLQILEPIPDKDFQIGEEIFFAASATDEEDGDLAAAITWEVLLHHNDHTHFNYAEAEGPRGSFIAEGHGENNIYFELCARVRDRQGLMSEACRSIRPHQE